MLACTDILNDLSVFSLDKEKKNKFLPVCEEHVPGELVSLQQ